MAITITPARTTPGLAAGRPALWFSPRQRKVWAGTITGDTSYPTGGYDISALWAGFKSVDVAQAMEHSGARVAGIDKAAKKLKLYTALGTEAANASNQSAISVDVELIGF